GDSIASNVFMLGYAWQKGYLPLGRSAIERAIELNGVAVQFNKLAFAWGRLAAHETEAVIKAAKPALQPLEDVPGKETLDDIISKREKWLTAYQDEAYARRYRWLVDRVRHQESSLGSEKLTEAVARYAYKLMAYKDEYEVARLYTNGQFKNKLGRVFDGKYKLRFHMAPPLLARRNKATGELRKMSFGPWVYSAFKVLAKFKKLRGTMWDIFGYTEERKME